MWPFTKKPKQKSAFERRQELITKFRKWKPVGGSFKYLGRTMIVTGHSELLFNGHGVIAKPCINADYVDNLGKIHNIRFSEEEAIALMNSGRSKAKNKRSK